MSLCKQSPSYEVWCDAEYGKCLGTERASTSASEPNLASTKKLAVAFLKKEGWKSLDKRNDRWLCPWCAK